MDTSLIEGYENMTAEEKLAALEAFEMPTSPAPVEDNTQISKLKNAVSKANSEAAEYKRQLREKQTEQERIAAEQEEQAKLMKEQLAALQRDKTISTYKASYLSLGYDEAMAEASAIAITDGDMDTFFANQKMFLETQKQRLEAEALNHQPKPSVGETPTPQQIEEQEIAKLRKYAGLR